MFINNSTSPIPFMNYLPRDRQIFELAFDRINERKPTFLMTYSDFHVSSLVFANGNLYFGNRGNSKFFPSGITVFRNFDLHSVDKLIELVAARNFSF